MNWPRRRQQRRFKYINSIRLVSSGGQWHIFLIEFFTSVCVCEEAHPVKHAATYYVSTYLFTPTVNTNRKIKQKTNRRWRCQYLWEDNNNPLGSRLYWRKSPVSGRVTARRVKIQSHIVLWTAACRLSPPLSHLLTSCSPLMLHPGNWDWTRLHVKRLRVSGGEVVRKTVDWCVFNDSCWCKITFL